MSLNNSVFKMQLFSGTRVFQVIDFSQSKITNSLARLCKKACEHKQQPRGAWTLLCELKTCDEVSHHYLINFLTYLEQNLNST